MKKLILTSLALLLIFAPAMAGDFQALNNLSAPEQMALNTMTDEQLAVVEGAQNDINQEIDQEIDDVDIDAEQEIEIDQRIKCDDCGGGDGGVFNFAEANQNVSVSNAAANVAEININRP